MDEATREARRKALAEEVARLKRAADSNASAPALSNAPTTSGESSEEEADDELDWDLEPGADQRMSVSSADVSDPNLDALDSSWDDEEEEEEPEPELPDEGLDPVAYAEAKAAREERARARRERKRAKDAAKRARQKQRALEAKRKQKSKSKKPRVSAAPKPPAKSAAKIERTKTIEAALDTSDVGEPEIREVSSPKKSKAIEKKSGLSPTNAWILAVIVLVFIGAIGFAFFRAR